VGFQPGDPLFPEIQLFTLLSLFRPTKSWPKINATGNACGTDQQSREFRGGGDIEGGSGGSDSQFQWGVLRRELGFQVAQGAGESFDEVE